MNDNSEVFRELIESQEIALRRGSLFDYAPGSINGSMDFGRIEGMMLGLAIGDSLGNTSESTIPSERFSRHGEIHDYLPNRHADMQAIGLPSDDTQMAFWTLEQMLKDGGLIPDNVAERFCEEHIFGIGKAVREFIRNHKSGVHPWHRCAAQSAGNGALMRIAPMLIPHLKSGTTNLWVDTALSAAITHNDSASISACLAFVHILWQLLAMDVTPDPEWWVTTYLTTAKELETGQAYSPRGGDFEGIFTGPLGQFVEERLPDAYSKKLSTLDACNSWYSGAYLLETVPSVLYILMCYADDPEQAIIRAVNDTRDNDTIAAIVGAAVGALHCREALPERWIKNLSKRTGATDDGRVFDLLKDAQGIWWQ
jgi:ADP-ribosylglycohydrolase